MQEGRLCPESNANMRSATVAVGFSRPRLSVEPA